MNSRFFYAIIDPFYEIEIALLTRFQSVCRNVYKINEQQLHVAAKKFVLTP
ncbi:hypothetical protein [Bacillus weihaiensis]|uniref:hypothetical protein n=1 Tax=Bacillus weihaiensis TaxID=1547283 RepID=UPI0023556ACF|nr:hypothetical protein [Bacillus weihaiensis]